MRVEARRFFAVDRAAGRNADLAVMDVRLPEPSTQTDASRRKKLPDRSRHLFGCTSRRSMVGVAQEAWRACAQALPCETPARRRCTAPQRLASGCADPSGTPIAWADEKGKSDTIDRNPTGRAAKRGREKEGALATESRARKRATRVHRNLRSNCYQNAPYLRTISFCSMRTSLSQHPRNQQENTLARWGTFAHTAEPCDSATVLIPVPCDREGGLRMPAHLEGRALVLHDGIVEAEAALRGRRRPRLPRAESPRDVASVGGFAVHITPGRHDGCARAMHAKRASSSPRTANTPEGRPQPGLKPCRWHQSPQSGGTTSTRSRSSTPRAPRARRRRSFERPEEPQTPRLGGGRRATTPRSANAARDAVRRSPWPAPARPPTPTAGSSQDPRLGSIIRATHAPAVCSETGARLGEEGRRSRPGLVPGTPWCYSE